MIKSSWSFIVRQTWPQTPLPVLPNFSVFPHKVILSSKSQDTDKAIKKAPGT